MATDVAVPTFLLTATLAWFERFNGFHARYPNYILSNPICNLVPILLLHSTRHLGMMFLTRCATYPGLPPQFAYPAAFGDLITAILAFVAIPLVLRASPFARPAVWVFNVFGTVDLLVATATATLYNAPIEMGPAYWIPAFWVPLLLVTHYITFVLLRRGSF